MLDITRLLNCGSWSRDGCCAGVDENRREWVWQRSGRAALRASKGEGSGDSQVNQGEGPIHSMAPSFGSNGSSWAPAMLTYEHLGHAECPLKSERTGTCSMSLKGPKNYQVEIVLIVWMLTCPIFFSVKWLIIFPSVSNYVL